MPRRKRTSGDGGRRAKVCRVVPSVETLVISDSEHEEDEDFAADQSSRAARWRRRKSKSHEMTEEEMLHRAMQLSTREANTAAQRKWLEDNDIQKAIAESLNVADRDGSVEAPSSSSQSHQIVSNEISHLRRKLSYPGQNQTHDGRKSPAVQDHVTEKESTSPLPEMPDLSQMTSSLRSSSPSAASQHGHESSQDKTPDIQLIIKDSEEDKLSVSQPKPFVHQPFVYLQKLSQDPISASTCSKDQLHTKDNAVGPISASESNTQMDSSISASYVLTQNDLRGRTDLVEEDTRDQNASEGNESDTQIPDSPTCLGHEGLSSKNTDSDKCMSPSKMSSSPNCVPENADVTVRCKTPDPQQAKDHITQVEKLAPDSEAAPNAQTWDGFHSHMVLHLDDDEDDNSEEVLSPSPVSKDKTWKRFSPAQPCISSAAITLDPSIPDTQISQHASQEDPSTSKDLLTLKSSDSKPLHTRLGKGECTVSYYWGVPFCPRGQNPDDYTRVIMCQLEVYEKSLKEAQRKLMHKVEWSQPVFPDSSERSFGLRRLRRYRAPLLSEEEEQNDEEGEMENKRKEVNEEREEARKETVGGSEERVERGQSETYVVLSSPETKDEDVQKNPFLSRNKSPTATTTFRNDQWDTSDNTQIDRADEEEDEVDQNHDQIGDEEIVCPETQLTPELMVTSPAQPQSRADSEVMEVDDEGGVPAAEEEVMEQENVSVECPMCSRLFPITRIEMHAAFCDGENHQEDASQVVRNMRSRREPAEESQHRSENGPADSSAMTSSTASHDTDCLTDFQQQDTSRNSLRLTRKRKFKR